MKIETITLSGFRGATKPVEIAFDTTKPVTLIFGENGTGKSTIADAVDFICNRQYGSLEDRSIGGQPRTHIPTLGCKPTDVKVTLAVQDPVKGPITWQAALTKDGPIVTPSAGCPDAWVLRRSNILELLVAQPKERYEALKDFIAVPGIEKSEAALREAGRIVENNLAEAIRAYQQAGEQLDTLWIAEGKRGASSISWAESETKKDLSQLKAEVTEATGILSIFNSAQEALKRHDAAAKEKTQAESELENAQANQLRAEAAQAEQSASLVQLLEDAKSYISGRKHLTKCPVCEQQINAEQLLERLSTRSGAMNALAALIKATELAKRKVTSASTVADRSQKTLCEQAKALGAALKNSSLAAVTTAQIQWSEFNNVLDFTIHSDAIEQVARKLLASTAMLPQAVGSRKDADDTSIKQQNALTTLLATINNKATQQISLDVLLKQLKKALSVVETQRKDYVEGILVKISAEVETLYTKLHSGEGIGKVRFYLKPSAIGSLEFDGQFQNKTDVPPQAYYSESHLDTLGICVFLALAKYFKTDNTIVVLDDVVTSVDSVHLGRFMDLLHGEAPNFNQVIVTTHYRPWKDRYKHARGPAANTQLLELRRWEFGSGIQTDEDVTAVEELRECLAAAKLDRQAVASRAGIQLESILDYLTYRFRCKMPRQTEPNYTLGDLAMGVDSKLGKLLKVVRPPPAPGQAKQETMLKPLIDDLTSKAWVRNQVGCHFNVAGAEIADAEIQEFGSKVLQLGELLICSECQEFPARKPSGSYWQCECGKIELHPLISPAAPLGTVA